MRTLILVVLVLGAAPDASIQRYGLSADGVRDTLFSDLTSGNLYPPGISSELHSLDAGARAAAVKALGGFAKAYFASSEFKQRYAKLRTERIGPPPKPMKTVDQIVAQRRAEMNESFAQSEEAAKQLPAEQQADFKKVLAQMRDANERALADRDTLAKIEQLRFQGETAEYQKRQQQYPEEPTPLLKAELKRFLDATADVDFNAKLVACGDKQCFADQKYESKPDAWKYAFRAGREATRTAREVAQSWLSELK